MIFTTTPLFIYRADAPESTTSNLPSPDGFPTMIHYSTVFKKKVIHIQAHQLGLDQGIALVQAALPLFPCSTHRQFREAVIHHAEHAARTQPSYLNLNFPDEICWRLYEQGVEDGIWREAFRQAELQFPTRLSTEPAADSK